jgi:hypothetical protein
MAVMALLIPSLGLPVVEALCHAMIPRSGSEDLFGSRMTPSVFVLIYFVRLLDSWMLWGVLPADVDADSEVRT